MSDAAVGQAAVAGSVPVAVIVVDRTGKVVAVNPDVAAMTGAAGESLLGKQLPGPLCGELGDGPAESGQGRREAGEDAQLMAEISAAGRLQMRCSPLHDERGEICGGTVTLLNAPAEAREPSPQPPIDPLTELPNRTAFGLALQEALEGAQAGGGALALAWLNLDRFKQVNDALGQHVGDELLRAVGSRLRHTVRASDVVARSGGDDFLLLLRGASSRDQLEVVKRRIGAAFTEPFRVGDSPIYVTASCGMAVYPHGGADAHELLENAHTAMQAAKRAGGAGCRLYADEINVGSAAKMRLAAELREAIQQRQFVVFYQPQLSASGQRVAAVEALVRWAHPRRGLLAPAHFIPFAEESGLIEEVGLLVIDQAAAQAGEWRARLQAPLRVAVNVSAREFQRVDLLAALQRAVRVNGLSAADLEVEITETAVLPDPARAAELAAELRAAGFGVTLDDFGTGYSSLTHLRELPIDRVKIDRSFVASCLTDASAAAIVLGVTRLAHSLRLEVVAEGVETEAQRTFLAEAGCDSLQGYLLARPLAARDCEAFLAGSGRTSALQRR